MKTKDSLIEIKSLLNEAYANVSDDDNNVLQMINDAINKTNELINKHSNNLNKKPYYFASKIEGCSWSDLPQTRAVFCEWADAVELAYELSRLNGSCEVRMSESKGYNNQGHYFYAHK